ncbi:MAG: NFACT RNA binding domain-containing protein [archaeon]
MQVTIDISKSVEENAGIYFDKAKKLKKKALGAKEAVIESEKKLAALDKIIKKEEYKEIEEFSKKPVKKEWYEKFRWFISSTNFLVIAGRDSTTNEIIIKKNVAKEDVIFHTSISGSPFAVIKSLGKEIDAATKQETADFTASFSSAWKLGMSSLDIFYVNPDQVTKETPSGEYIQKGSFMIYGKKTILPAKLNLFIGKLEDGRLMIAPKSATDSHCKESIEVFPGNEKSSETAKKIKAILKYNNLDDIIRILPSGGCVVKWKNKN